MFQYPIKNKPLLIKSGFALFFVITVFFLHSIPDLHLSLGCTAFMGALLLLIIADMPHLEGILGRVEWSTLLFFSALFILMEVILSFHWSRNFAEKNQGEEVFSPLRGRSAAFYETTVGFSTSHTTIYIQKYLKVF